jgi:peptidoglycan/xylan/chitin deacetylase (PgdA/CDA1 family)
MRMRRLTRQVQELGQEAGYLRGHRYPDFVTSRAPARLGVDVPVFVYHTIEPELFEEQLSFLRENGYYTATAGELHDHLTGSRPLPQESVVLTIDDGRSSVYTHAFPLLQKFDMRATVFLIPGYVPEQGPPLRTLSDYWSGACPRSEVQHGDPELMGWDQIAAIADAGVLDFQSHTLYHHRVFTGPRIVDFVRPDLQLAIYDIPVPAGHETAVRARGIACCFGMPIYENDSLMSGRPRYLDDPRFARACTEFVASAGGAAFFETRNWRTTLHRWAERWRGEHPHPIRYQTSDANEEELVGNLRQARQMIGEKVGGAVEHLCYPYGIGSARAARASQQAGYHTNFWAVRDERSSNRPGDDPFGCPRLKADYIFRLPGRNRKSLRQILAMKLQRRIECRPVF